MSQITEFKISWKLTGFIGISDKVRFSCNQQLRVYFLWEEQANQRQITLKFIDEIKVCQLITIPKGAMGAKSCALVFVLQTNWETHFEVYNLNSIHGMLLKIPGKRN